jgi:hypothetical protein
MKIWGNGFKVVFFPDFRVIEKQTAIRSTPFAKTNARGLQDQKSFLKNAN